MKTTDTKGRRTARAGRAAREGRPQPDLPGHPSLLYDDKLVASIMKAIRVGVHPEIAARSQGVSKTTYYRWIKESEGNDRKFEEGLPLTEYEKRTREFRDEVDKAETYAEMRMVAEARQQARTQQTAAGSVSMLERRFPARWKFTQATELTGKDGGAIEFSDLSDEDLEDRLKKLGDIAQEVTR